MIEKIPVSLSSGEDLRSLMEAQAIFRQLGLNIIDAVELPGMNEPRRDGSLEGAGRTTRSGEN